MSYIDFMCEIACGDVTRVDGRNYIWVTGEFTTYGRTVHCFENRSKTGMVYQCIDWYDDGRETLEPLYTPNSFHAYEWFTETI